MMNNRSWIAWAGCLALLVACRSAGAVSVESEALRAKKGVLILQCGSDWCVSGESVRGVFESTAFKKGKVAQKYALATYDEMENPTAAAKAKNEDCQSLLIRTKRFPAITCYTPEMKVFAQIENVPYNVDVEKLSRAIAKVTKRKDEAEALFKKAATLKGEAAADAYGQGFDILAEMMTSKGLTSFHFKELTEGAHGWRKEWDELVKLDAGDKYGWLAHFRMNEHETVRLVDQVTAAKEGSGSPQALVNKYKAIPDAHFTANQKQCVKVMEYAVTGKSGSPLSSGEKKLLKEAVALGEDTFWGQFAKGRLMMDGEKLESKGLYKAKVRPRPANRSAGSPPPFGLDLVKNKLRTVKPGAELTDAQKLDIARYAVFKLVGSAGWSRVLSRPGGDRFLKAFINDREWMEDFAWSGSFPENSSNQGCKADNAAGAAEGAILALESLIFQDGGRWVPFEGGKFEDNEGRRFMTALAIVYPDKDEEWLADVLDAYRSTALAERLHKSAYDQPVWLWRFAVHQGHATGGCDNMAAQQRHMERYLNMPLREYGSVPYMRGRHGEVVGLEYRLKNCFGDSVHGPLYYRPWGTAGEWPKRRYSQIVGGVCGELSKFGSAATNAHGLPASTVGQPGHCAYTLRQLDGRWTFGNCVVPGRQWKLDNNSTEFSYAHMCFWNKHPWQYLSALGQMYDGDRERRLSADRLLELAHLAEERDAKPDIVEAYFRRACNSCPNHYRAWLEYGQWVERSNAPVETMRTWLKGATREMKNGTRPLGRQPLWDLLTPFFARVAKESGPRALADELIAFAPNLKQSGDVLAEEADFGVVLSRWSKLMGDDAQLRYDVLKAMLAAQVGTRDYFSYVLGWGSEYFIARNESATFIKCLEEALSSLAKGKEKGKGKDAEKPKVDFKPLILSASRSDNLEAFRQMVALQAKLAPNAPDGQKYPQNDFGGELLGAQGLLKTSTTCGHDDPSRYGLVIDDSPCGGNGFHTDKEKAPWAQVMLAGPTAVTGVVIENRAGGYNGTRQVPLFVDVSDDGTSWRRVHVETDAKATFRIDLRSGSPSAKYVRVGRVADAKEEVFHLNKILVYGKKLY